jgi:capsular polysaccharide biosynthesis protein
MEIGLYLRTLRRGWWIIALTILVAANVSLLVSYFTPPVYQSFEQFIVSPNSGVFSNSYDLISSMDVLDRRSIINTYSEILSSPSVYGKNPDIQKMDPQVLASQFNISVVVLPDTNIIKLVVEGPNPNKVLLLTQSIGSEALSYINKLYPVYNLSILDQPELPTVPIRPQPLQSAGLSILFGAIIGVLLAFTREQLQVTVEKLRERSIIDDASSAFTRSYFERRLSEEVAQRSDVSFALGLINLRGLEEVSTVLPQPIMDRLIYTITQTLKSELRGRDIVGRWDKTQLAVLLPATPISAVEATFKRIQLSLAAPVLGDNSGDIKVRPDPCIGVGIYDFLGSSDEVIQWAQLCMERASALEEASIIIFSKPFLAEATSEAV